MKTSWTSSRHRKPRIPFHRRRLCPIFGLLVIGLWIGFHFKILFTVPLPDSTSHNGWSRGENNVVVKMTSVQSDGLKKEGGSDGRQDFVSGSSISYHKVIQSIEERLISEWMLATRIPKTKGSKATTQGIDSNHLQPTELMNFFGPQLQESSSSTIDRLEYRRTHNHHQKDHQNISIVLVTHLSVDRINDRLPLLLDYWNGPISVAIYIRDMNQISMVSSMLEKLSLSHQEQILLGETILHFLFEPNAPTSYPHNRLRNLAMKYNLSSLIGTKSDGNQQNYVDDHNDFVLAIDVDFLPPWDAHTKLMELLVRDSKDTTMSTSLVGYLRNKTGLVLPVFNLVPPSTTSDGPMDWENIVKMVPKTREEAVQLYHENILRQWEYKAGHQSDNYTRWLQPRQDDESRNSPLSTSSSYSITPSKGYEPYFIAHRPSLPTYYDSFRGFGLDKQSFVVQVILEAFQFRVLVDFYLVHISHSSNRNDKERERNIVLWQRHFKPYLRSKYPNVSKIQKKFFNIPFNQD